MSDPKPPKIEFDFDSLPVDPRDRHEALVDLFGQHVTWLRNWSVTATAQLVESEESRKNLGTIRREKYDTLASLTPEQKAAAREATAATVDRFIQLFLTMASGTGIDQRIDDPHAIRFKIDLEVCEIHNSEVVEQETINRRGKKFFADYWGAGSTDLRRNSAQL
ncbi:hypothetical protein [Blastopirellula marina]|uniref:Uncharacterized protein n=1 Tax=Blastopirellula marina DSM 3645 TaxID=314230 RepID=A3ZYT3_9BACT|nr:hypothetical protein [Blastopirellula marina]EAQ78294.1 hypothetical protein DSM3645_18196 [Blastopirellula marina DSM 3645]